MPRKSPRDRVTLRASHLDLGPTKGGHNLHLLKCFFIMAATRFSIHRIFHSYPFLTGKTAKPSFFNRQKIAKTPRLTTLTLAPNKKQLKAQLKAMAGPQNFLLYSVGSSNCIGDSWGPLPVLHACASGSRDMVTPRSRPMHPERSDDPYINGVLPSHGLKTNRMSSSPNLPMVTSRENAR